MTTAQTQTLPPDAREDAEPTVGFRGYILIPLAEFARWAALIWTFGSTSFPTGTRTSSASLKSLRKEN